jgi:hypothetical protein
MIVLLLRPLPREEAVGPELHAMALIVEPGVEEPEEAGMAENIFDTRGRFSIFAITNGGEPRPT